MFSNLLNRLDGMKLTCCLMCGVNYYFCNQNMTIFIEATNHWNPELASARTKSQDAQKHGRVNPCQLHYVGLGEAEDRAQSTPEAGGKLLWCLALWAGLVPVGLL